MKRIYSYKNKFIKKYEIDLWGHLIFYSNEDLFFQKIFKLFCFRKRFKFRFLRFYFKRRWSHRFRYSTKISKKFFKKSFKKFFIWKLHTLMKFRVFYGIYNLKKFIKYLQLALKKNIDYISSLLLLLECRLDMILYRSNFFLTPQIAKEFIKKGFVYINNKVIYNYKQQLYINDIISIKNRKKISNILKKRLEKKNVFFNYPKYLEINYKILKCLIIFYPKFKDVPLSLKKDLKFLRKIY